MKSPWNLDPVSRGFDALVLASIAGASAISVPESWLSTVREYAHAYPDDDRILLAAIWRRASFWRGGLILDLQPGAAAMTLDDDVFVSGSLSLSTFVHELVHVLQYLALAG